ncbi:MAG: hypothetical protein D6696_14935 [Acidobacteria bacterium]|nr:MAG: hypothetical protein D6696_14935 [Acidobacteriota bacterium]
MQAQQGKNNGSGELDVRSGYDVTPSGQVVVEVDVLRQSPAVQEVAKLAREIVRRSVRKPVAANR